ncbi:MAG: YebC/PmpR family DNA-binding transcriptional regulator [Planctomycetota bacterium]
MGAAASPLGHHLAMAGHSHSANIKFRKDRVDSKRARAFSKLARMITVAAKLGGGDPHANPRLRLAVEKARVLNMPKDNIERAIKKGAGGGDAANFEEIVYEGYAPCGVAVMLDILTDNRNRTAPEVRKLFERGGGNLAAGGSVAYMFERKALFTVDPATEWSEDRLMELALEAGAEDLIREGETFVVHGKPGDFVDIKEALEGAEVPLADASVGPVPGQTVEIDDIEDARKVIKLLDALEEHDDVQSVSANYVLTEEVTAALAEEP